MLLDHLLYVNSFDQIADKLQHPDARLGSSFIDDGIHLSFSAGNYTLPLQNGHYPEVVCPPDHPSSYSTPFGKPVSQLTAESGGCLTWVVVVDDVSTIEKRLERATVDGHCTKPDEKDLSWKQISILGTLEDKQLQFFIEWLSLDYPSTNGKAIEKIVRVEIFGDESYIQEWLGSDVEVEWFAATASEGESGIVAVHVMSPSGVVRLD